VILAKNLSKKWFLIIASSGVLLMNLALQVPNILFIGEFNKIAQYTQSEVYLIRDQTSGFIFIYLSLFISVIGFFVYSKFSEKFRVIFLVYICAPLLFLSLFSYPVLASRVPTTILSLNCIMIPAVIYRINYRPLNISIVYISATLGLSLVGAYYMRNYLLLFS
jgi:hypothetical protein